MDICCFAFNKLVKQVIKIRVMSPLVTNEKEEQFIISGFNTQSATRRSIKILFLYLDEGHFGKSGKFLLCQWIQMTDFHTSEDAFCRS